MTQSGIWQRDGVGRWGLLLAFIWTVAIAVSLALTLVQHRDHLYSMARIWAETALQKDIAYRRWNAGHGGVYAEVNEGTPPNPHLTGMPERDVVTPSGRRLTLVNPAYMTRQVLEQEQRRGNIVQGHITSLRPLRSENAPDPWESEALRQFEAGAKSVAEVVETDSERRFRMMVPLYVSEACMRCHAKQGYEVGDVRGGLSVTVPVSRLLESEVRFAGLIAGHGFLWAFGMLGIGLATRKLARGTRRLERTNRELLYQVATRTDAEERLRRQHAEQKELNARLKQAHDQLLQSEKLAAIGQLAAGVAHEINNPTGYVISNLHTLDQYSADLTRLLDTYAECEAATDPEQREALRQRIAALKEELDIDFVHEDIRALLGESQEGMERVRRIVQDLKNFSHPDRGEWEWADLQEGVESTLNVVWNELKYNCEVVREYSPLPRVRCIPAQINQVIMNLLVNAAQAIDDKGVITIRTGQEGERIFIEVRDTGRGIAAENIPRLFEPFYTTKPVGKGTGLGLSLSYGIVQRHGGDIEVESEPGKGSVFRVWLPVGGPGPEADPAPDPQAG